MPFDPGKLLRTRSPASEPPPMAGTRAERIQRLQIGLFGIGAMVLLVGLADVVISRAEQTQAAAVPEAAPTVEPSETPGLRDPLADAGVVPELPAQPTPTAGNTPPTGDLPAGGAQATNAPRQ